jgi:TPP-dependent pyruvate/acetoin dehydrogenase alpha subunit
MRMRGHSEQDDASYVPRELLAEWEAKDPIDRYERRLMQGGIMDRAIRTRSGRGHSVGGRGCAMADQQSLPEPDSALRGVYGRSESGQA